MSRANAAVARDITCRSTTRSLAATRSGFRLRVRIQKQDLEPSVSSVL